MTRGVPFIHIVLVCMLAFSICGCGEVEVEDNLIPDTELHSEIRSSPYLDDAPITVENMLKLIELDATEGGDNPFQTVTRDTPIFDVTGLEYAENLVVLRLGYNRIVDVSPLEGLKNLRRLHLRNNAIVDISPLERLKNLQRLGLDNNELVDINPLAELRILYHLSLDNNNIVDVSPLEGSKNLRWLYLSNNVIVDISPLQGLKNLQELDLTGNPLSDDSKKRIIPIIEANGTKVSY